jgi:hypothetical protein
LRRKQLLPLAKLRRQNPLRMLCQFRRRTVDDDEDEIAPLREQRVEARFALAPVEIGRDQLLAVGVYPEMLRGIDARADRGEQKCGHHDAGVAAAEADNRLNGRHGVASSCEPGCR